MSKKRKPTREPPRVDEHDILYVSEYEITPEPIQDKRYRELPRKAKNDIEQLHALVQSNPRQAIEELPEWIKRYPDLPMLYNYLSVAYSQTGAHHLAEQTILENFQRNPTYLFARLNYAEICLAKGNYQKAAEVLEYKFDLKLFYPHRKRFHISEFVGFMSVVGRYFAGIGDKGQAQQVYEVLHQIAPDDPATRQLRRELHPGVIQRIARRLLRSTLSAAE